MSKSRDSFRKIASSSRPSRFASATASNQTAFDEHRLDGILPHFAADAVFEGPRGPYSWKKRAGERFADP
jgi:hypothetical protein